MSSLKGPKHGGANIQVMEMMEDIRSHVKDYGDKEKIAAYLDKIIDKQAFDKKGLVYGMEKRHIFKGVSPNVDFYSGFVYDMLGIPMELYTAIFAVARIVGWSAHRIEELICEDKIIRPSYMSVMEERL